MQGVSECVFVVGIDEKIFLSRQLFCLTLERFKDSGIQKSRINVNETAVKLCLLNRLHLHDLNTYK